MKVTKENINNIKYIYDYFNVENGKPILLSLLDDLEEFNQQLDDQGQNYMHLYIDYIDEHTGYSIERTEPCPDYYGMFRLKFEKNPYESVGEEMTLNDLDNAICILTNFIEFKLS